MTHFSFLLRSGAAIDSWSAGYLINTLRMFDSNVYFYYKERCADAKKIFQLLELNILQDDCVYVIIRGEDAREAYSALRLLLADLFPDLVELSPDLTQKQSLPEASEAQPQSY